MQRIKQWETSAKTDKLSVIAGASGVELPPLLQLDLKSQDLASSCELAAPTATMRMVSWLPGGDMMPVDAGRQAAPRSLVIERLNGKKELAFKQLLTKDGQHMLQVLSPDWTNRTIPINGHGSIGGAVMGKVESFI